MTAARSLVPLPAPPGVLHTLVRDWYADHARDLPWRTPDRTPWGVLVSEVMLQQTPVARVLPVWAHWMQRWPTPADLAGEPAGAAVRAWDRLGYPRRALRLHAAAVAITDRHDGVVPDDHATLLTLPGVGEYTAAAVAAFAFGGRHVVLDTNVRRVLARVVTGVAQPGPATTAAQRRLGDQLLPAPADDAATWSVGVMELGALVCTARSARCEDCPLQQHCAWRRAGHPEPTGPARRAQAWAGTDRQARGALLAVLRARTGEVSAGALDDAWTLDDDQRARALAGLVEDGLVERTADGGYRLPGETGSG